MCTSFRERMSKLWKMIVKHRNGITLIVVLVVYAIGMIFMATYDMEDYTKESGTIEPTEIIETISPTTIIEQTTIEMVTTVEPTEVIEITEEATGMSDYERWVVECMVMGEAGGESYEGQVLVAQCILNACNLDGLTPSEVRVSYQYSGWNDYPSESVKKAVSAVFDEGYTITDEPILYFYAHTWSTSDWHETQRFVIEEGSHRFFARW